MRDNKIKRQLSNSDFYSSEEIEQRYFQQQQELHFKTDQILKYKKIFRKKEIEKYIKDKVFQENEIIKQNSIGLLRIQLQDQKFQQLEFDLKDIEQIFGTFGKIDKTIIRPGGIAFILYENMLKGYFAYKALNNMKLNENVTLKIQLCQILDDSTTQQDHDFTLKFDNSKEFLLKENEDQMINHDYFYYSKFICDIKDEKFNSLQRFLGARGCNIQRIYYLVSKQLEFQSQKQNQLQDLKIKVGNDQENQLNVVIFGNNIDKFNYAIRLAHELLANIYEEYKRYCEFYDIEFRTDLRLKKIEKFKKTSQIVFLDSKNKKN